MKERAVLTRIWIIGLRKYISAKYNGFFGRQLYLLYKKVL